jgi:hypothetical protein
MTEPTPQTEESLNSETCWALLERVAASPQLRRSARLQELLRYVGQRSLKEGCGQVHEQEIGFKVFGRPETYDTSVDNIVRTNVSDLRKRIEAYFKAEGLLEPVILEIPRGSYVPVFKCRPVQPQPEAEPPLAVPVRDEPTDALTDSRSKLPFDNTDSLPERHIAISRRVAIWALASLVFLALTAGAAWKYWPARQESAVDDFWRPILHDRGPILLCAGGNTFAQNPVPGFFTAGKETDYPYFSLQTEISTTLLSTLIERHGATPQFKFAASTPLPELHEYPVILLNAYNNQWTLRLVQPHRFHFAPQTDQAILDGMKPQESWRRDPSVPYSSADDYALIARYWDTTTDNWVVVLAGLGRNGTEAATQFVVSPQYMQMLRNQLGRSFSNRNIEVVLKVSVIDGKTGAPSIMAVNTW